VIEGEYTYRQKGDLIRLLLFFQSKGSRLKVAVVSVIKIIKLFPVAFAKD
jgi:hypothetical protein